MLKGINLQAKVHMGSDPASADKFGQSLSSAFAQANPGLRLESRRSLRRTPMAMPRYGSTLRESRNLHQISPL